MKLLNGSYNLDDKVTPKKGPFKGKVGTVHHKGYSRTNHEWFYVVKFVRARHTLFEDELQPAEVKT